MKSYFPALAAVLFAAMSLRAQNSAFTYQGVLNQGNSAATGPYDFRFRLFDVNSNVVAGPLTNAPVAVNNGQFITTLDFGAAVFDGSVRTLEIGVRTNGDTSAYAILSPRQPLNSVPYAIQSLNASNAVSLTAPLPATNLTGTIPNTLLSPQVALLSSNVVFTGNVTATNFTGNGFGLSNLPAISLIGTISDARLSTNVAMLNATNANFQGNVTGTNFTGNGFGLSNLPAASLTGTVSDARLSANVALQSNPALNFAGNVAATNFSGGGHGLTNVPGAFFWVVVSGTNVQAQPNVGYICTNNLNPVIIALPSAPSIGDTFRVAGVGGAGWIIAQTNSQMILAGNLAGGNIGQTWRTNGPLALWSAVASSASGIKLVATIYNNQIYTSTNAGSTWVARATSQFWSAVASSSDGTRLVATIGNNASTAGPIYTSTDSGATWASQSSGSGTRQWVSVASSADGTRLVAANYGTVGSGGPGVYTSVNGGTNWVQRLSVNSCSAVASSADGSKLVAAIYGGQIYTSTNYGTNWTARGSSLNWSAVASSSDGSRLAAAVSSGQIYLSADSGATWTPDTPLVSAPWTSVCSSSDGSRLAAVASGTGNIYNSTDSGSTWVLQNGAPATSWSGIASSADGSQLVAVANPGGGSLIYLSSQFSTTTGTNGYATGSQQTAVELLYVGNGIFQPLSHEGTIRAY
ncbi:MAG TPA: hypothetical protein VMB80_02250 [Candidatus Acidoferrum sp.]|nr:hypothetical protein [Candidatus Acidoferrum sp.]